jgi:hypothetical protein
MGTTQPSIQWVPRAIFPRAKRPRREADHSPLSSVEVKNATDIYPLPSNSSGRGA